MELYLSQDAYKIVCINKIMKDVLLDKREREIKYEVRKTVNDIPP
jgi:hypothetical protein